jgi:hypothetical protein
MIKLTKSQSSINEYDLLNTEIGWICNCADHMYRAVTCKYIHAVELSLNLRKKVEKQVIISEIVTKVCPQCKCDKIPREDKA